MKRFIMMAAAALTVFAACEKEQKGGNGGETPVAPAPIVKNGFAEGADISWVTQMEEDGVKFYNAAGAETECTALMKEIGFDAIRLRVWVNPEGGWCGKEDVLVKAKRAQALGMRIMIDFHYSDTWADPSNQNPPAAWAEYSLTDLVDALSGHTKDVLNHLKDNGVDVEWVQIGNEINDGFLWPRGKVSTSGTLHQFVKLANAGYDSVKSVFPSAKVILHVSNGHDAGLFKWFFDTMKYQKVNYDIIGMSLYPTWWENGGWTDWSANAKACIANMKTCISTYGKPVMLCEIGMPVSEPEMSKEAIQYILDEAKKIENCHGIFCWEPQTDGKWKPSSYETLGWNAYDKGAFADGRPTIALDPFKN